MKWAICPVLGTASHSFSWGSPVCFLRSLHYCLDPSPCWTYRHRFTSVDIHKTGEGCPQGFTAKEGILGVRADSSVSIANSIYFPIGSGIHYIFLTEPTVVCLKKNRQTCNRIQDLAKGWLFYLVINVSAHLNPSDRFSYSQSNSPKVVNFSGPLVNTFLCMLSVSLCPRCPAVLALVWALLPDYAALGKLLNSSGS